MSGMGRPAAPEQFGRFKQLLQCAERNTSDGNLMQFFRAPGTVQKANAAGTVTSRIQSVAAGMKGESGSDQNLIDHISMNIGETKLPALVAERQSLVVDPQ